MFKILNKKYGKATAAGRVLYLPYVTLIWGNSAENRKGRRKRSKSNNIQKYKDSTFIGLFSMFVQDPLWRLFLILSMPAKRF
jgi:hypothetical protein